MWLCGEESNSMMACASISSKFLALKPVAHSPLTHSSSPPLPTCSSSLSFPSRFPLSSSSVPFTPPLPLSCFAFYTHSRKQKHLCRAAAEYVFPDPIPEFAESETGKFRNHLLEKLSKKDVFGDSVKEVVGICTEILSNFLLTEYGGPGTLLVIPFIDMADTINERGLPGGPQAARAAVVWAQKHVDTDWKEWAGGNKKN